MAATSAAASAALRPGAAVDPPYPGRSYATSRRPRSAALSTSVRYSSRALGVPWCTTSTGSSGAPTSSTRSVRPSGVVTSCSRSGAMAPQPTRRLRPDRESRRRRAGQGRLMTDYAIVRADDVDDAYAGSDVPGEFRRLTRALGCDQLSATLIRIPPHSDFEQGTGHFHDEVEELYHVTRGTLTMRFGDDIATVV